MLLNISEKKFFISVNNIGKYVKMDNNKCEIQVKKSKKETLKTVAICIISVLLVISFVSNALVAIYFIKTKKEYKRETETNREELSNVLSQKVVLESEIEKLKSDIQKLKTDKQQIEESLQGQIEFLKKDLENKIYEQNEINKLIEELRKKYSVDLNKQMSIMSELNEMLKNPPDKVDVFAPEDDEKTEYVPSTVALYYLDLNSGYKYSFNENRVFSSASVVKLPYALSLLKKASEEKNARSDSDYVPLGFSDEFVYTLSQSCEGSGVIANGKEGDRYTYFQLIDYSLRYSDNVAFSQLQQKYGMDYIYKYVSDSNIKSMKSNIWNLNAADCALIMKDVYDFIEIDKNYGSFLKQTLCESMHTTMTVLGLSPKKCAHKYGWDENAYHDVTLVYDKNPYIIVFLSDLHQGGAAVDSYITNIARKVDLLHENFYETK